MKTLKGHIASGLLCGVATFLLTSHYYRNISAVRGGGESTTSPLTSWSGGLGEKAEAKKSRPTSKTSTKESHFNGGESITARLPGTAELARMDLPSDIVQSRFRTWLNQNPSEAVEWMQNLPVTLRDYYRLLEVAVDSLAATNPELALSLAGDSWYAQIALSDGLFKSGNADFVFGKLITLPKGDILIGAGLGKHLFSARNTGDLDTLVKTGKYVGTSAQVTPLNMQARTAALREYLSKSAAAGVASSKDVYEVVSTADWWAKDAGVTGAVFNGMARINPEEAMRFAVEANDLAKATDDRYIGNVFQHWVQSDPAKAFHYLNTEGVNSRHLVGLLSTLYRTTTDGIVKSEVAQVLGEKGIPIPK